MSLASADLFTLRSRQCRWLTTAETLVVFLYLLLLLDSRFPTPFQLPSHEPIFRFDSLILPRRPLGLVSSPLTFLPALLMQSLTLLLDIGRRGQMQFHRAGWSAAKICWRMNVSRHCPDKLWQTGSA